MSADLEREAREQQKKAGFLAQPQDLYACQHEHGCAAFLVDEVTGYFDGQPCDCGANSRWGDLASKRMRANEQEIERLNELLKFTRKAAKEACADNDAEIATLRARVEELEAVLNFAQGSIDMLPDESWEASHFPKIQGAIHEVRAQAAEAGKVRMPKVREFLSLAKDGWFSGSAKAILDAALAELDAAEGRK